jgi:hypothetical protein
MGRILTGFRVAVLVVVALIIFTVSRIGYGQGQNTIGQPVQCQAFQKSLAVDLFPGPGSSGTILVTPRTTITIEQIALRIDAIDHLAPAIAAVTTTVRSITSAYYLPIPGDSWFVVPARPLTLMQSGPLHADGGTNVTLSVSIDPRYFNGSGRAEWSVSGMSCPA